MEFLRWVVGVASKQLTWREFWNASVSGVETIHMSYQLVGAIIVDETERSYKQMANRGRR